jgi:hypothetical protein
MEKSDIPFEEGGEPTIAELLKKMMLALSGALAASHANTLIMILELEATELSPLQQEIVARGRKELTRSQNAFLKVFGDMDEPGKN